MSGWFYDQAEIYWKVIGSVFETIIEENNQKQKK
jgi:hypothetical protein